MKYRVVIHPSAKDDLDRNALWWAENHSPEQAITWLSAMERQLQTLSSMPERCGLSPENDAFAFEIRDKLIGLGARPRYRAIFTIQGDAVHVLTIRRGAQDVADPRDMPFDPSDDST